MDDPVVSFVLPTWNRPDVLGRSLRALAKLRGHTAEVIIVDNASRPPVRSPNSLDNGWPVQVITLDENRGTAGRNVGVELARADWILMLDDDSYPLHTGYLDAIAQADDCGEGAVAAIGGEILLADQSHEAGGLPCVFVGCGVLIRRDVFLDLGGYDASFDYYVEEYDLAARMLGAGLRIAWDRRLLVRHDKVTTGRDMDVILHRLIRNNGWVIQRYAPDADRAQTMDDMIERYRRIAVKESAEAGAQAGEAELRATVEEQPRRELDRAAYEAFIGLRAVREHLPHALSGAPARSARIVDRGKSVELVEQVIGECGVALVDDATADIDVIGTLSPGPLLDGLARAARERPERVTIEPWDVTSPQW
jgi:GT2 family glycosyltransferase